MDGPLTFDDAPDRSSPVNQLVTALVGDSSVLVTGMTGTAAILASAAPLLADARTRVLQPRSSDEFMMFMRQASPSGAGSGQIGLEHGFNALTILDPSCDRIALLVGDAHLLSKEALDYIDFALGAAPHLQVALAGQPSLVNLLAHENFRQLRKRLKLHLVPLAPLPALPSVQPDSNKALTEREIGSGSTAMPTPAPNVSVQRPLFFTEQAAGTALSSPRRKLPRSRNMAWFWGELVGLILIGLAVLPLLDQLTGSDYVTRAMQALGPHGYTQGHSIQASRC